MDLLRLILAESRTDHRKFLVMLVISALGTTLVLALVNRAAQSGGGGHVGLALLFLACIYFFAVSQRFVMSASAREVETLIHRLRLRIMERVRAADLAAMQQIGRAPIYAAVAQETQSISNSLPVLVVGGQQAVLLIFVSLYLAWLSFVAFLMAGLFGLLAIAFHLGRLRRLKEQSDALALQQGRLFEGLRGLLAGFKEVTLNRTRGDSVLREIVEASQSARDHTVTIKRVWSREFVATQLLFYLLLGVMVFVVPLFTTHYHDVIVEATVGALFMVGPLGALAQSIPAMNDSLQALRNIRALEERLLRAGGDALEEEKEELPADLRPGLLELEDLRYEFRDAQGKLGFALGPVSARFRSGEIVFITGGNGSGKSTLFRLMTGLVHPQAGRLLLDGTPLPIGAYAAYRDRVAAVFSDYYLFRRLHGLDEVAPERIAAELERFELTGKTRVADGAFTTTDLSAGQRKRLALVVALLEDTPILMLDEWAADQDPLFRRRFYEEILPELKREGRMLICITHDERYFGAADRIYHMADGKMRQEVG